jgi:hypothetical protein
VRAIEPKRFAVRSHLSRLRDNRNPILRAHNLRDEHNHTKS